MHIPSILTTLSLLGPLILPMTTMAGSLTPPGAPAAGSGMPTTTGIYNRLDTGAEITTPSSFQEPAAGPTAGVGKSLSDIKGKLPAPDDNGAVAGDVLSGKTFWGLKTGGTWGPQTGAVAAGANVTGANGSLIFSIPNGLYSGGKTATANDASLVAGNIKSGVSIFGVTGTLPPGALPHAGVKRTGQTQCWDTSGNSVACANTGQDGAYQYGIYPAITPTAGTTGAYNTPPLISGTRFFDNGDGTVIDNITSLIWLKNANCFGPQKWSSALTSANTLKGDNTQCGLSDGSTAGQWRLPNINELHSLGPAWPPGAPFAAVEASWYWSSNTYAYGTHLAWYVIMIDGDVNGCSKGNALYIWPVRSGQ